MTLSASRQTIATARWVLALALAPLLPIAGAFVFQNWLENHVNIHSDAFLVLFVFFGWTIMTITVVISTPWKCWELAARCATTPSERRLWRIAIIATNLVGCIAFLATLIWNGEDRAEAPSKRSRLTP